MHTTFHIPSCHWLLPSIKICHNKFFYFQETGQQQNLLLGEYDVCLSNVDVVYQLVGEKKRRLVPGSNVSGKVNGLHILCKVILFYNSMVHGYPSEANSCSAVQILHIYETQRFVAVSKGAHHWPIS